MSYRLWLLPFALVPCFATLVSAQPVISARAGLIQFADGVVFLDGDLLRPTPGRFYQMNEGSTLRTQAGRVELQLTPGVFLRLGDNSAVQMIANRLSDTRLRLVSGAAIVDAAEGAPRASVTILYGDYQVQTGKQGLYRFNSDPAELRVEGGEARVDRNGDSLTVDAGHSVPLSGRLMAQALDGSARDALDTWNQTRSDSVAAGNLEAAKAQDLSNAIDSWQNDPASSLSALGMSGYLPPPGYIPTAPYTTWMSSPYTPLSPYGSLYPLNSWGYGWGGAYGLYGLYGVPLNRNYFLRSPVTGVSTYRLPTLPAPIRPGLPFGSGTGSFGAGRSPVYNTAPRPVSPTPARGGAAGHAAGHR